MVKRKVFVTGQRGNQFYKLDKSEQDKIKSNLRTDLGLFLDRYPDADLVHGDAQGIDRISLGIFNELLQERGQPSENRIHAYPADWKKHGKAAGPKRNSEMVDLLIPGQDVVFFAHSNITSSIGTGDSVNKSQKKGMQVFNAGEGNFGKGILYTGPVRGEQRQTVVVPRLGKGLADLENKAPKTYEYLQHEIEDLKKRDDVNVVIVDDFFGNSDIITSDSLKANPEARVLYGDNKAGRGKGGQAIYRDESNAFGIITKAKPERGPDAYLSDDDYEANKKLIHGNFEDILGKSSSHTTGKPHTSGIKEQPKVTTDKFKSYQGTIGFSSVFPVHKSFHKSPEKTKESSEIEPDDTFITFPSLLGLDEDKPVESPYAKPPVVTPKQMRKIETTRRLHKRASKILGIKLDKAERIPSEDLKDMIKAKKDGSLPDFSIQFLKEPVIAQKLKKAEKEDIESILKTRNYPKIDEKDIQPDISETEEVDIVFKALKGMRDTPLKPILDDTRVDYTRPKETDTDRPTGIHVIRNYTLPSGDIIKELKPNRADYQELVQSMGKEKAEKYIANAWLGGGLNPYGKQYTIQYDAPDIKKFKVKEGVPIHGPARPGERRRSAYFAESFDKLIPGQQTGIRRVLRTDKEKESKEETLEEIKKSGKNHPIFSTLKSQQDKEREKEAIKHKDELQKLADEHGVDVKATKDMSEADKLRKEYGMGEQYRGRSVKSLDDALEHVRLGDNVQNIVVDTGKIVIDSRGHEAKLLQTVAQATKQDIIDMPDSEYTTWFFSQLGRRQKYVTDPDAERIAGWAYHPEGHPNEGEKIVYLTGNEVVDSSNPKGKRALTQEEIKAGRQGGIPSFGDVFKTKQWQHFNDDMVKSINAQRNQDYVKGLEFQGVTYNSVYLSKNIEGQEYDADGNRIPLMMKHKDGKIPLVLTYTGDKQKDMKEFNMTEAEYDEHFTNNNPEREKKWKREYQTKIAEDNTYVSRRPNETEEQFNKRKQEYDPDNTGWTKYERQFMKYIVDKEVDKEGVDKEEGGWARDIKAQEEAKHVDFQKAEADGKFSWQKGDKAYYKTDKTVMEPLLLTERLTAAFNAETKTNDQNELINQFKNFVERDTFDPTGGAHQIMDSSTREPRKHGEVVSHDDTGDLYTSGHGDIGSGGRLGSHIGKAGDPADEALLGPVMKGYTPAGSRVFLDKASKSIDTESDFDITFNSGLLSGIKLVAEIRDEDPETGDYIQTTYTKYAVKTDFGKKQSFGYGLGDFKKDKHGHAISTSAKGKENYNKVYNKITNPDSLFTDEKVAWNSLTPQEQNAVRNVIDYRRGNWTSGTHLSEMDEARYERIISQRSKNLERGSPSATLEDGTPNPKARFIPKHKYLISSDIRFSLDSEGGRQGVSAQELDAGQLSSYVKDIADKKLSKELKMNLEEFKEWDNDWKNKPPKMVNKQKKMKWEIHKGLPASMATAIIHNTTNKKSLNKFDKGQGVKMGIIDSIQEIMYTMEPPKYKDVPIDEEPADASSQLQDIDYTDQSDLIEDSSQVTKDSINDLTNNLTSYTGEEPYQESDSLFDEFKKGTLKFKKDADKNAISSILPSSKETDEKQKEKEDQERQEYFRRQNEILEKQRYEDYVAAEQELQKRRLATEKDKIKAAEEAAKTVFERATETKPPPVHGKDDPMIEVNLGNVFMPFKEKATITEDVVNRILETPNTIAFNRNAKTNVNGHSYKFTDGKAKIMKIGGKTISEVNLPDLAKYTDGSFQFIITEDPSTVHATTKTEADIIKEIKNNQARLENVGGPTNYYTSDTNGKTGEKRTKQYDKDFIGPKRTTAQKRKQQSDLYEKMLKEQQLKAEADAKKPGIFSRTGKRILGSVGEGIIASPSKAASELAAHRKYKLQMAAIRAQGGGRGNRAGTMESMANFAKMLDTGQQRGMQFGKGPGLFSERDTAAMMGSGQSRLTDFSIQGRSQSSALTDFAGRVGQQGLGLGSNLAGQMMSGEGTRGIFTSGKEFLESRGQPSGMQFVGQRERDVMSFSLGGTLGLGGSMRPEQGLGSPSGFLAGELISQKQTQNRAPNGRNNGAGFRGYNHQ